MKNVSKTLAVFILALSVIFVSILAMANTTITGEVDSANEIITADGIVYIIADTEKGGELASMVGETVKVIGTVQEVEGEKVITIDSFSVVTK
jgi:hypothetical protein